MNYTTDIWFAGYLMRSGFQIKHVDKSDKKAKLGFAIDAAEWQVQKLAWMESVDMSIKYTHEKIKDIIFQ
jgi:hypothetical protein